MIISNIRTDYITGSRRFSNYWWATIILLGGLGFFLAGIFSYLGINTIFIIQYSNLSFLPQGVIMVFYGTTAVLLSIFLWLTILWNVGGGYNQFNNEQGIITIFRLGFPGKNRILKLDYKISDVLAIKVKINEGINPKREIYIKTKDKREIPITSVSQPMLLSEMENKATSIAKFIGVILEGLD